MANEDFNYEIVKHVAVLSEKNGGWNRELNLVSWNGGQPKYDIRDWSFDHKRMGKGVSLTKSEMMNLFNQIGNL